MLLPTKRALVVICLSAIDRVAHLIVRGSCFLAYQVIIDLDSLLTNFIRVCNIASVSSRPQINNAK